MEGISLEEIKEALARSGYIIENRVLHFFSGKDFWAESSHRFFVNKEDDKYREIDVLASKLLDSIDIPSSEESLTLYLHFIIECINNPVPLALFENIGDREEPTSDWMYELTNGSGKLREIGSISWQSSIEKFESTIIKDLPARQYCGFVEKKGNTKNKWMACHPEDFHQTLIKIVQFVKYKQKDIDSNWEGIRPDMARLDLLIPLVVLQGEMVQIKGQESIEVLPVGYFRLKVPFDRIYNKSLSIDIVREDYLQGYLDEKLKGIGLMFEELKEDLKNSYI